MRTSDELMDLPIGAPISFDECMMLMADDYANVMPRREYADFFKSWTVRATDVEKQIFQKTWGGSLGETMNPDETEETGDDDAEIDKLRESIRCSKLSSRLAVVVIVMNAITLLALLYSSLK